MKTLASLQDGVSILDQSHSEASPRNKYCRLAANDRQPPDSYSDRFRLAIADDHVGLFPEAYEHLKAASKIVPRDEKCVRELNAVEEKMK